jgi:GH15 family glucan-1,4-alpha-glucosidase
MIPITNAENSSSMHRGGLIETTPLIEDHGMIGDMHTAALISKNGTMNWLCLPSFDSDACFAALLGNSENGYWNISPTLPVIEINRNYRKDSLILETEFITEAGVIKLIDFMPLRVGQKSSEICRIIRCTSGSVPVCSNVSARFGFGHAIPLINTINKFTKLFAGPDALYLQGGPTNEAPSVHCEFILKEGQEVSYSLSYGSSYDEVIPAMQNVSKAEEATEKFWTEWCSTLKLPTRYRDLMTRSLITLKACIYKPTGGIVAAPTTSLPETPGGERNWDYRYCWLRDGSLAIRSFILAGLEDEAREFYDWMLRAIAGDPSQVQIMYGIRGERRLTEVELDWLGGYQGARPVRIGNGAYDQRQLDVYGELAMILYEASSTIKTHRPRLEKALLNIANYVATVWQKPDRGIWEMRGPERSFTASKVAAWTAIDRAIRYAEEYSLKEPMDELRAIREKIFVEVCRDGFNAELNTFTQYYGGTGLDASLLIIPMSGFLPVNDPRVIGTVEAIERELIQDGLLLRYKPEKDVDGLSGDEGVFLACSFWLATVYQMMGRAEDARKQFESVTSIANDLGLFAEEYDPKTKRQLGNFPQAFSHFAMINTAFAITKDDPKRVTH